MKDYNIFTKKELVEFLEKYGDAFLPGYTAYEWLAGVKAERLEAQMEEVGKEINMLIKGLVENIETTEWLEIHDKLRQKRKKYELLQKDYLKTLDIESAGGDLNE